MFLNRLARSQFTTQCFSFSALAPNETLRLLLVCTYSISQVWQLANLTEKPCQGEAQYVYTFKLVDEKLASRQLGADSRLTVCEVSKEINMTVEHAHTVDNGVYQQRTSDDPSFMDKPAAAIVEFLDEEHGGYKTPDVAVPVSSSVTLEENLSRILVLRDFRSAEVWRASVFEGVASFVAVFVGTLATTSTLSSSFTHPVLAIALSQALILSLCILAAAPASGGHVNPLITWTETLTGHITPVRGFLYLLFQILGSIFASLSAKAVVGETLALQYSLGGCYLHSHGVGLEPSRAFLLETLLTFFVLFITYSIALDPPRLPRTGYTLAPFIVGGIIGLCIFAAGGIVEGYGGAGMNPGRCIGPAVVLGQWEGQWVFWAGPGVAGVAMAGLYWKIPPTHVQVYKLRKAARAATKKGSKKSAGESCRNGRSAFSGAVMGSVARIRGNTNLSSGNASVQGGSSKKTTTMSSSV